MQENCIKYFKETGFAYLLELSHWGHSNKYPKHMFYEEIRTKQGFFTYGSLYNSKFILMVMSLGTNAVIVMKVQGTKEQAG